MKRRGHLARASLGVSVAATVSTVTALRGSLGIPATLGNQFIPHLLQPTEAGFQAMSALLREAQAGERFAAGTGQVRPPQTLDALTRAMRGDPSGFYPGGISPGVCVLPADIGVAKILFRAFKEFYEKLEKTYKTLVFEQIHVDRFEERGVNQVELSLEQRKKRAKHATLAHMLMLADGQNMWAAGQNTYSAARDGYLFGTMAGPLILDWLTVGNIPVELEARVLEGDISDVGAVMARNLWGHGEPHDEGGFIDHFRNWLLVRHHPGALQIQPPRSAQAVALMPSRLALSPRGQRKKPALEKYNLYDLVVSAWLWHSLDEVDPYIGSAREKSQLGPPGEIVGTFPSGEKLVRLTKKRAVMIEGKLRGLCLRHSGTAQSYLQRGEILSLRDPRGRIIFTMSMRPPTVDPQVTIWASSPVGMPTGGYNVAEVKGANNASLTDERHKALLEQVKRGIGVDGIFNAPPALRDILRRSARQDLSFEEKKRSKQRGEPEYPPGAPVDLDEVDRLLAKQGAPPFKPLPGALPHMRVFKHPVSPEIIGSVNIDVLTKKEQLQLYEALALSRTPAMQRMAEVIKGKLPFDVLGSVSSEARMDHGLMVGGKLVPNVDYLGGVWVEHVQVDPDDPSRSWDTREVHHPLPAPYRKIIGARTHARMKEYGDKLAARVKGEDGKTLAQARSGRLFNLSFSAVFPLRDKKGSDLNKLMFLLSRKADQKQESPDESEKTLRTPSRRLMDILPKKPVRWRGSTGAKIIVRPSSGWVAYQKGWGAGVGRYHRPGYNNPPKIVFFPRSVVASEPISSTISFHLNVSNLELRMPLEYRTPHTRDREKEVRAKKRRHTELVIGAQGYITIKGARRGTFTHLRLARLHAQWIQWARRRLESLRDVMWPEAYDQEVKERWRSAPERPLHEWLWVEGGVQKLIAEQEEKLTRAQRELRMARWAAKGVAGRYGEKNQLPAAPLRHAHESSALSSVYMILVPPG